MRNHIRWKEWMIALTIIVCGIIAIDFYLGAQLFGATVRFIWNGVVFVLLWSARSLEAFLILLTRRRAMRVTTFVTGIGIGYASSVVLNDTQVLRTYTLKQRLRMRIGSLISTIVTTWRELSLMQKFAATIALILCQIILLPAVAAYIVLFPIGFLAAGLVHAKNYILGWLADTAFGRFYVRYFGKYHSLILGTLKKTPLLSQIRGAILLTRLRYLTAWRLWKHAPCYRKSETRRRISLFEPCRLWWRGELDMYVGRPLLSGKNGAWPITTYEPPLLWYERIEKEWQPFVSALIIFGITYIILEMVTPNKVIANFIHHLKERAVH